MNAAILSKRALQLTFITLSLFVLAACSGVSEDKKTAPELFSDFSESAEYLLKQADQVAELQNSDWQLAAIQALTKEGKYILANSVIEHIQKKVLTIQQKNNLLLMIADNQYAQNQLDESLLSLDSLDITLLSESTNLYFLKLKAELQIRKKDHQGASDTLLVLTPLLTIDEEKQQYNDILLTQLSLLPADVLNKFQKPLTEAEENTDGGVALTGNLTTKDSNQHFEAELAKIEAEMASESTIHLAPVELTDEAIFVQGWYALASLYQRYQLRPNQLIRVLEDWELIYPTHPVLEFMPTQLVDIPEATPYHPTKVAVLLPLSGRFKKPAEALQYGISHAFYNQIGLKNKERNRTKEYIATDKFAQRTDAGNQQGNNNNYNNNNKNDYNNNSYGNSDSYYSNNNNGNNNNNKTQGIVVGEVQSDSSVPSLIFFDTNQMDMQQIAEQLHLQNIDFVIGPLLKPNLELFLPLVEDIPVLALNGFPSAKTKGPTIVEPELQGSSLHYAFPLSPESEAEQAAEMIFQNKHKKPLLLAPKSDFGQRVSAAFKTRWNALNEAQQAESGTALENYPAESHLFTSKSQFANFVGKAMQTDKSKQRINQMKTIINRPIEAELRSRRDIDAIYLVSDRSELILLKPFIGVTISPFASSIPLYASSRSHSLDLMDSQNKELSDLTFSDIAFLMNDHGQINQEIQSIWPKQSFATLRLFALGYDSYNLIEQLKQLQVIKNYNYQGVVGELTLDNSNTINSKLHWAKYQEGSLIEVTAPTSSK